MSFILDALKKSEIERQRQTIPGLMDSGTAPRRTRLPLWALALAALLAVNLIVLLYVLRRGGAPAAVAPAAVATMTAPRPAAAPDTATTTEHFSPLEGAPVYAPEIPAVDEPQHATVAPSRSGEASVRTPHRDPLLTDEDAKPEEVLPSISEVNLSGEQALPDLHLDVHVYATKPAERFVYINMRKYREGATLQEGPTLERIRRDGVVLNFHGVRFVLPRQQ